MGVAVVLPDSAPARLEPRTIAFYSLHERGAETLSFEGDAPAWQLHEALPLAQALTTRWPGKVFAVTYEIAGEPAWPRLNGRILPELRERGAEVRHGWIAVDLDFRPHAEVRPSAPKGRWDDHENALTEILDALAGSEMLQELPEPTAFYTTRHGFRAVYVFQRWLSSEEYETAARNLARYWERALSEIGLGRRLQVDEKCLHWNALFALPFVTDPTTGEVFEQQPWFRYAERPDARLDPARFVEAGALERAQAQGGASQPPTGISLESLQADGYLTTDFRPSQHAEHTRQIIQSMLGVDLFGDQPVVGPGSRDDTLTQVAGAVAHIVRSQGGAVENAAAFMVYPGAVLNEHDEDADPKDWIRAGIEKVCRFWSRDYTPSKTGAVSAQIRREEKVEQVATMLQNQPHVVAMAQVVYSQIGDPDLLDANPDVVRTALKRVLVFARQRPDGSVPDQHFYLLPSGFYSRVSLKNPCHDPRFVDLLKMLGEDHQTFGSLPPEARALAHGNVISQPDQLMFWPGEDDLDPTTVRLVRTSAGLAVQSFQLKRTPAKAKRSMLVEGWLRALAGEQFGHLESWIAAALAVEEGPVPALFLFGESNAGKTLFIEQICRAFSGPGGSCAPTAGASLLGGFEDALEACPVVAFDEAGGSSWSRGESSLVFRRLAGCRQFVARRKFKAPANCRIAYRVVCAANNANAIKAMLAGDTRADTDAVARRLLVIGIQSDQAIEYLRDHRIPENEFLEHFRWLYWRRRDLGVAEPGGYMLVPPDLGPIDRDEAIAEAVANDPKTANDLDLIAQYICEQQDLKTWADEELGGWLLVSSSHAAEWLRVRSHDPSVTAKRLALQLSRFVQGKPTRMFRGGEQRRVVCIEPEKLGLLLKQTHCDVNKFIARAQAAGYIALDRVLAVVHKA